MLANDRSTSQDKHDGSQSAILDHVCTGILQGGPQSWYVAVMLYSDQVECSTSTIEQTWIKVCVCVCVCVCLSACAYADGFVDGYIDGWIDSQMGEAMPLHWIAEQDMSWSVWKKKVR